MNGFRDIHGGRLAGAFACGVAAAVLVAWTVSTVTSERYERGLSGAGEVINARFDTPVGEITEGTEIAQTFIAERDHLTAIDIRLATYGRRNTATLTFALSETGAGRRLVRETTIQAEDVVDNRMFSFDFESLPDSQGQPYVITLTSSDGQPGNALTAWAGACACDPAARLYVNGQQLAWRDLAITATYGGADGNTAKELVNRLSQYKPEVLKGPSIPALATFAAVVSIASVGLLAGLTSTSNDTRHAAVRWTTLAVAAAIGLLILLL